MKIAIVTESNHGGKLPPGFNFLKTELVWQKVLDAEHISWASIISNPNNSQLDTFDAAIVIIPKSNPEYCAAIKNLKNYTKILLMQEGPSTYWQEWGAKEQEEYFKALLECDGILCHNECDKNYFEGLTGKKVAILPTMTDFKIIEKFPKTKKLEGSIIIGGNACTWYNGSSSIALVRDQKNINHIFVPSMGRKIEHENALFNSLAQKIPVTHLPFLRWPEWMVILSQMHIAIHMMPTIAAGSFSLNCASFGIPCIGNLHDDTQRICFPELSFQIYEMKEAREALTKLLTDRAFYKKISEYAQNAARSFFHSGQKEILYKRIQGLLA